MSKLQVYSSPESVSVTYQTDVSFRPSIASAEWLSDHWWVSRVMVLEAHRGKGVGTLLVAKLLDGIRQVRGGLVVVAPGGYGSDPKRLTHFYEKCGFTKDPDEVGMLSYSVPFEAV